VLDHMEIEHVLMTQWAMGAIGIGPFSIPG